MNTASKHISSLENVITTIKHIGMCAEFYKNNLIDILSDMDYKNSDIVNFSLDCYKNGMNVADSWTSAVKESALVLTSAEKEIIIKFGLDLCSCNSENIRSITDYTLNFLEEKCKSAKEEKTGKSRPISFLSAAIGVVIVLVLI